MDIGRIAELSLVPSDQLRSSGPAAAQPRRGSKTIAPRKRKPPSKSTRVKNRGASRRKSKADEERLIPASALVAVVDDDESVRESLPDLLREFGFAVEAFSSAEAFLASDALARTQCLVLDVAMPGMSGPELQRELERRKLDIPVVFISAHADALTRLHGTAACLVKPFSDTALLAALEAAMSRA